MNNICDHWWAESAFLSEWWAVCNLRKVAPRWGLKEELEFQVKDEIRHSNLFLKAMLDEGHVPRSIQYRLPNRPTYALQETIYGSVCGLDLEKMTMQSQAVFREVHELTERRAIWIYRTYIRGGNVERYKDLCREIIEDERTHIHAKVKTDNPVIQTLQAMDKWVFLKFFPKHYNGMQLLQCEDFWNDYYQDNLKTEIV